MIDCQASDDERPVRSNGAGELSDYARIETHGSRIKNEIHSLQIMACD
jgi:hypothetical protein